MTAGITITLDVGALPAAAARLGRLAALDTHRLMEGLGALGQSQTQRRISSEKTTPEGAAWPKSQEGGSTLFKTGSHLFDSIDHAASETQASWGSGWIGARVHQFGAVIKPVNAKQLAFTFMGKQVFAKQVTIPARKYLGVSEANAREMEATAIRFIERVLQ